MLSGLIPVEEMKEEGSGGDKREKLGYGSLTENIPTNPQGTLKLGKPQSYPSYCESSGPFYSLSDQSGMQAAPGRGCDFTQGGSIRGLGRLPVLKRDYK